MSTELNTSKKYSLVVGISGAHFKQDGEYFSALGKLVKLSEDGLSADLVEATPAKAKKKEKLVEFDIDSVIDLTDFDAFAEALKEADTRPAKTALKSFATDIVGMEKINTKKGLPKLIEEVRAEYKSVLEMDIE